jgi:hypothetical protein
LGELPFAFGNGSAVHAGKSNEFAMRDRPQQLQRTLHLRRFFKEEVNNFLRVRIIDDGTFLIGSKIRHEESETLIFVIERIGKQ